MRKNPEDFDALFAVGRLHCVLASDGSDRDENYYKALNYLMAAEEINPESAVLHDRLATVHDALGDSDEADRHRKIARRLRRR